MSYTLARPAAGSGRVGAGRFAAGNTGNVRALAERAAVGGSSIPFIDAGAVAGMAVALQKSAAADTGGGRRSGSRRWAFIARRVCSKAASGRFVAASHVR